MPRKWEGKWFQSGSGGNKKSRQGRGRGNRSQRAAVATASPRTFIVPKVVFETAVAGPASLPVAAAPKPVRKSGARRRAGSRRGGWK